MSAQVHTKITSPWDTLPSPPPPYKVHPATIRRWAGVILLGAAAWRLLSSWSIRPLTKSTLLLPAALIAGAISLLRLRPSLHEQRLDLIHSGKTYTEIEKLPNFSQLGFDKDTLRKILLAKHAPRIKQQSYTLNQLIDEFTWSSVFDLFLVVQNKFAAYITANGEPPPEKKWMIQKHVQINLPVYLHIEQNPSLTMIPDEKLPPKIVECLNNYRDNIKKIAPVMGSPSQELQEEQETGERHTTEELLVFYKQDLISLR